jgi:tRNA (mo5U34)-methyltransferase
MKITDPKTIAKKISTVPHWYHQILLPDGSITPGINKSAETFTIYEQLGFPINLKGKRVLDIGCSDGYLSFIAEQRGASEVIAIDYRLPSASGFAVAAEILGSKVTHIVDNVYDLSPEKYGLFDFVIFVGVLYHLRNPLLALDRVRSMSKPNTQVLVESHVADAELTSEMGKLGLSKGQMRAIASLPLWNFYYSNTLNNDASNKWAPTLAGLYHICNEAQLRPSKHVGFGSRGAAMCIAIEDSGLEHSRTLDSSIGVNFA